MAYVYHVCIDSVVRYIGVGKNDRYKSHLTKSSNPILRGMLKAAGTATSDIIMHGDRDFCLYMEQRLIAAYGRIHLNTGQLTNLTEGGEVFYPMSAEAKLQHYEMLKLKMTGRKQSDEAKAKLSDAATLRGIGGVAAALQATTGRSRSTSFRDKLATSILGGGHWEVTWADGRVVTVGSLTNFAYQNALPLWALNRLSSNKPIRRGPCAGMSVRRVGMAAKTWQTRRDSPSKGLRAIPVDKHYAVVLAHTAGKTVTSLSREYKVSRKAIYKLLASYPLLIAKPLPNIQSTTESTCLSSQT